jgi:hypothetical protein
MATNASGHMIMDKSWEDVQKKVLMRFILFGESSFAVCSSTYMRRAILVS